MLKGKANFIHLHDRKNVFNNSKKMKIEFARRKDNNGPTS